MSPARADPHLTAAVAELRLAIDTALADPSTRDALAGEITTGINRVHGLAEAQMIADGGWAGSDYPPRTAVDAWNRDLDLPGLRVAATRALSSAPPGPPPT